MLVLTGQLRTSQSKKGQARHIGPLTLGEKPELFLGANLLINFNKGTFFFSSTRLGMLAVPPAPRLFHSTLVLGYRCQGFGRSVCIFPICLRKQFLKGCGLKPSHHQSPTPSFERIGYAPTLPPKLCPSKCSAGPQEALVYKASIQDCHLTDSKKVAGRWTAVCRWTWRKKRAEQIKSEHSKGKVLNHRPFQTQMALGALKPANLIFNQSRVFKTRIQVYKQMDIQNT